MTFVSNVRNTPFQNTLERSVPQIEINKEMASKSGKMDQFGKFFQEMRDYESDLEDSTPPKTCGAPLKRKKGQFCTNIPAKRWTLLDTQQRTTPAEGSGKNPNRKEDSGKSHHETTAGNCEEGRIEGI